VNAKTLAVSGPDNVTPTAPVAAVGVPKPITACESIVPSEAIVILVPAVSAETTLAVVAPT
jgi:hypothetical protein